MRRSSSTLLGVEFARDADSPARVFGWSMLIDGSRAPHPGGPGASSTSVLFSRPGARSPLPRRLVPPGRHVLTVQAQVYRPASGTRAATIETVSAQLEVTVSQGENSRWRARFDAALGQVSLARM